MSRFNSEAERRRDEEQRKEGTGQEMMCRSQENITYLIMISLMHAGARKKDFIIRPSVITFIRVFVSCGNFLFSLSFVVKEKKKSLSTNIFHHSLH